MKDEILINCKDIEIGYSYAVHISKRQAEAIINANVGNQVSLGDEGYWAKIENRITSVRDKY